MRLARALTVAAAVMAPVFAFAAETPPNPGITDICWNEQVYIFDGQPRSQYTNEDYSRFKLCEDQKITKTDCTNAEKKALVGTVKYQIASGFSKGINRCEKSKCAAIGDSTMTPLLQKGCTAGVSLGGTQTSCAQHSGSTALAQGCAFASETASKVANLSDGSLEGTKAIIGICSNKSSECLQNCPGPQCPISQTIDNAFAKGAENVYVSGVGSGVTDSDQVNKILEDISKEKGATFLGAPTSLASDGVHFADGQYQSMLKQVGEFEAVPANLATAAISDDVIRIPATNIQGPSIGYNDGGDYGGGSDSGVKTISSDAKKFAGGKYYDLHQKVETEMGLSGRGFTGLLNGVANAEGTYGDPYRCSFSGPCGHFQYSQRTWLADSARMNGGVPLPLNDRFDPEISAKVAASSYNYYLDQYGNRITSAGINPYAGLYLFHNAGEGAGQQFLDAYAANPNAQVRDVLSTQQIVNNPSLYKNGSITLAQAEQNILTQMNGSTRVAAVSTPPVVRSLNVLGDQTTRSTAWLAPNTGLGYPLNETKSIYYVKPVGGDPIYSVGYGSSGSGIMSGLGGFNIGSSFSSFFSNLFGGGSTSQTPRSSPPPPPPTVTISALPNPVRRGQPIGVAWQSNGTSLQQPCRVVASDGRAIATANGGSQSISTSSSTPSTLTFTATCYGVNGQTAQQSASVTVQ